MKKILTIITTIFLSVFSFSKKEDILGTWITEKSASQNQIIVEIYEKDNKINGRVLRLTKRFDENNELLKDAKNKDKSKRSRTIEGIDFVYGFKYNETDDNYIDGFIYNPAEGKTYSCFMQIQENGTLKVRGFLNGMYFLGKTQYWNRYTK